MPGKAPLGFQLKLQLVRQRLQIMCVVARVNFHPLRQRSPRPVGFLRTLVQLHAKELFGERTQAELNFADQPRGEHCVENRRGHEFVVLEQQPQIVVRAVHDDLVSVQRLEQRVEIDFRQRINQSVAVSRADLNQADLFRIGVQTVGLGVERDPFCRAQFWQPGGKVFVGLNHAEIFTTKTPRHKGLEIALCPGVPLV